MSIPPPPMRMPAPPGAMAAIPRWQQPVLGDEWCSDDVVKHFRSLEHLCTVTQANINQKDFPFWLEYFWKEARAFDDPRHKRVITALYQQPAFSAAELANLGSAQARRDLIKAKGLAAVGPLTAPNLPATDLLKLAVLRGLLEIGFKDMSTPVQRTAAMPATQEHFRHKLIHQGAVIPVSLIFRGDGSDFAAMIREGGRRNRVDLGLCNMAAAWHPFSDVQVGGRMWFRRASGDNCLYSVTSVADKFNLAIGFPLLEDSSIYPSACIRTKKLALWNQGECNAAAADGVQIALAELRCAGVKKLAVLLATESYLYLTKGVGGSVNTVEHAAAECNATYADQATKCDERGIRGMPLTDFLVGFRLRRFHFGRARAQGLYAQILDCKYLFNDAWTDWDQQTDQNMAAQHFNGDLRAAGKLCQAVRKLLQEGSAYGENDSTAGQTKDWRFVKSLSMGIKEEPTADAPGLRGLRGGPLVYADAGVGS